ncbi:MAG TPA: helix-turn-helix transcriptional regulator [Anaerolineaceae bacterium]|nr:helix-turn-helix transcriptional regulator [Anaerolineaceae bacterium]
MIMEQRPTQVYIFGVRDTVRIIHVARAPDEIRSAVNGGNWEPFVGSQDTIITTWQAYQSGRIVIILPKEEMPEPRSVHLTRQEKRVLQFLVNGYTPVEIYNVLHISERSVRRYMNHLRDKFRAKTLLHMLAKAVALGMAWPDLSDDLE